MWISSLARVQGLCQLLFCSEPNIFLCFAFRGIYSPKPQIFPFWESPYLVPHNPHFGFPFFPRCTSNVLSPFGFPHSGVVYFRYLGITTGYLTQSNPFLGSVVVLSSYAAHVIDVICLIVILILNK